jgi:hypothetical protein
MIARLVLAAAVFSLAGRRASMAAALADIVPARTLAASSAPSTREGCF